MKKWLLAGCIVILCINANAQRTRFGLKAGVNLANYNDAANTSGARTGFHVGGLAHIHINRSLAFQPELVYSTQGAEFVGGKHKIDYINIPLLLQYMFRSGFRLETGPQVGFLTNAEWEENNNTEHNIKRDFKSTDLSWAFGLGYLTESGFGLDARFNLGLADVSKGGGDLMHRVWQFGVFYQFRR